MGLFFVQCNPDGIKDTFFEFNKKRIRVDKRRNGEQGAQISGDFHNRFTFLLALQALVCYHDNRTKVQFLQGLGSLITTSGVFKTGKNSTSTIAYYVSTLHRQEESISLVRWTGILVMFQTTISKCCERPSKCANTARAFSGTTAAS